VNIVAPEERPAEHSPDSRPKGLLALVWIACKELWCEAIPLWFPLLTVGIAILAVIFLDQTMGILQALIDPPGHKDQFEDALANLQRWHYWSFVLALCLWSFVNYQSTYILHQFDYNSAAYNGRLSGRGDWLGPIFKNLERFSPIVAGIGPSVAVAIGFFMLHRTYWLAEDRPPWGRIFFLYAPSVLITMLVLWRPLRWLSKPAAPSHSRALNDPGVQTEIWLSLLLLGILILFVIATLVAPQFWSLIGPAATLCVIASAFVVLGSLLVFWGGRWRIPLIFATIVYCIVLSFWNDNHGVRVIRDPSSPKAPADFGIREVLDAWVHQLPDTEKNRKPNEKTPLFIICAEGGGVRAAYWSARLLAYLEDTTRKYPDQYVPFSSRVLLISGVSGGSLGAVTFDALLDAATNTKSQTSGWFFRRTANFLGRDQLSEPLAFGAFIDTTQRFIPWPVFNNHDRAAGLEAAWERAWKDSVILDDNPKQFCRFDDDFRNLWRYRNVYPNASNGVGRWLPSLFLNGTSVELGSRIITSDCAIPTGDYPGAQDALHLLNLRDGCPIRTLVPGIFRISSAINLSTRFPGISPSGELPGDGDQHSQRVVDGGYFDNSGARTAWDNIVAIYNRRLSDPDHSADIIPWVIIIRTGPVSKRQAPTFSNHPSKLVQDMPTSVRPVPSHFMVDVLAPMRAFFNAWGARSGDSTEALKDGISLISQRLSHQDETGPNPEKQADSGHIPLERVDYSGATGANPSACGTTDAPHHDPYVIELNLEVDDKQIEKADAQKAGASTPSEESSDRQKKKLLLPLGWMLPAKAREVMETEIEKRLAPDPTLLERPTHDENWFRELQETQLGRVLSLLHRERPTGPETSKPPNVTETKPDDPKEDRGKKPGLPSGEAPDAGRTVVCRPVCRKPCDCPPTAEHAQQKQQRNRITDNR
jgi:hypothetical protein